MLQPWEKRSVIAANLFNPAFCGEVLKRSVIGFNSQNENKMPFSLISLILPFVLHKATRDKMPIRTSTYFHSWVDSNEHLFIDFHKRFKQIQPYFLESLMFLIMNNYIEFNSDGRINIIGSSRRKSFSVTNSDEVNLILSKAEFLGRWFNLTGNEQTIYMFLKIRP